MNARLFDDAPDYRDVIFPAPRDFQVSAHEKLREGIKNGHRRQLLVAPTGSGKCLGRDTPVLMADGTIKPVQDVQTGDQLLGPDGQPRNVLSTASGREQLYRVTPRKGMSYVVNASHILSLRKTPGSDGLRLASGALIDRDSDFVAVNVADYAASNKTTRHCLKGWRAGAIEFPVEQPGLLLEPYFLGCWLGDGCQHMPALASPPCRMVDEWKEVAARYGYEIVVIQANASRCPVWRIVSRHRAADGSTSNLLTSFLDIYGLRERKHIPHEYKVAPLASRLDLLAGMIDADGHMSGAGFDWISNRRELAEDFAFLCRSVGLAAYLKPCRKGIASTGFVGDYWRVSVTGDCSIIPCRDKPAPARRQKKRHLVHGISVESIGEGEYFGFEIDGDHLFLLGDFTVTHNTYLGLRVIHESLLKGRRALFVCDRTALIDQTSARADAYGLNAHGVVQANHWRRDNAMPFQIASIQTIRARGYWPEADVIVVDEAHTQYAATKDKLASTQAAVVGLTATPCSKGLGLSYTNMVNAATMAELTNSGVLVPMRILSCVKPDMAGAETSGGEWTARAASEREAQIIGDVVAEWTRHGQGRKTIAFGADIAYGTQLAQRFNEAGIVADTFTSETPDAERQALLQEFRKPDSAIRILVSVEALAKGFDVEDIGCVIDARPLRKSLSTAIQMWGRGLRSSPDTGKTDCLLLDHCIASGQRVLTRRGLVPIESVRLSDTVWDGHEFVTHRGVVSRGIRPVIQYAGLTATADHPVKTAEGWRTLGQCADEQTAIRTTGVGRTALRECGNYFTAGYMAWRAQSSLHACSLRMRRMRLSLGDFASKLARWADERLPRVQSAEAISGLALCARGIDAATMQKPEGFALQGLRRARDRVPFRLGDHMRSLDQRELGHSRECGISASGSEGQQRALRARKSAVGNGGAESEQPAQHKMGAADSQIQIAAPRRSLCRRFAESLVQAWTFIHGDRGTLEASELQAERQVWDILDAGPRNSFTCEGLLVHNSGNIQRFLKDFTDVYFEGFTSLDMSEKLDAVVRKDEEGDGQKSACPQCGYTPFFRRCMSCGHEKATLALVDEGAGEMREIRIGKHVIASDQHDLWRQLCAYARQYSKPEKQAGRAWYLYQDIVGRKPNRNWRFDETEDAPVTRGTLNKIKSLRIAYVKGRARAAA